MRISVSAEACARDAGRIRLRPLYPPLSKGALKELPLLHWEAKFSGDLKHILVDRFALHADDYSFWLDAPLSISQLQDRSFRTVKARIEELGVSPEGISQLAEWSAGRNKRLGDYLNALGSLRAYGTVSYGQEELKGQLELHTALGSLAASGSFSGRRDITAEARTEGFNLGLLLGREEELGDVAFHLSGGGSLNQGKLPSLSFEGTVDRLLYKGYEYQGIRVDADYKRGGFGGTIAIDDPNVSLTAAGQFNVQCAMPYIKGRTSVRHFNPHALGLTPKYDGTAFQGGLHADFQGNDIENMEGVIRLDSFRMSTAEETYALRPVVFEATQAPGNRTISLHSDFLQARMEGNFRLATLIAHCRQLLHGYLPSFIKEPRIRKDLPRRGGLAHGHPEHRTTRKNPGRPAANPAARTRERLLQQPHGRVRLQRRHPLAELQRAATGQHHGAGRTGERLRRLHGRFQRKDIGKSPVDFRLLARAAYDHVHTGLSWTNHGEKAYKGSIAADTRFAQDAGQKMLTYIQFHPSSIIINDSVWNVHASDIHIAPGHVEVDSFTIDQGDRHLISTGKCRPTPPTP